MNPDFSSVSDPIRFWRNLNKKDSVESAKYDIQFCFTCTNSFWHFFMDPDPDPNFSGSDPDFWPIRIRTPTGKKSDTDPYIRTRIRNTG